MDRGVLEQIITKWNPHFVDAAKGKWVDTVQRETYLRRLKKFMDIHHVIILSGVRRSGKSTIMHQLMQYEIEEKGINPKNVLYLNFEDILISPFLSLGADLLENLNTFYLETYNPQGKIYVFLDEIQNVKDFNRWIFSRYETKENVKFVISGSRRSITEGETATVLTGRNVQVDIYPLSFYEYLQIHKVQIHDGEDANSIYRANLSKQSTILHHLGNYLFEGGFPEIVLETDKEVKTAIVNGYYRDMLSRDILLPNNIRNSEELEIVGLQILADFTKTHSYTSIGKPQKLSVDTIKTYLSYFENAYLLFESKFFSYSTKETEDIQKPRKIYVVDNGMRNFNIPIPRLDLGRCAENVVYMELKKTHAAIYYWKGKKEVDFVVQNGKLELINVSYTDDLHNREVDSLIEGLQEFKLDKGIIITKSHIAKTTIKGKTIESIPLWVWLILNSKEFLTYEN